MSFVKSVNRQMMQFTEVSHSLNRKGGTRNSLSYLAFICRFSRFKNLDMVIFLTNLLDAQLVHNIFKCDLTCD